MGTEREDNLASAKITKFLLLQSQVKVIRTSEDREKHKTLGNKHGLKNRGKFCPLLNKASKFLDSKPFPTAGSPWQYSDV